MYFGGSSKQSGVAMNRSGVVAKRFSLISIVAFSVSINALAQSSFTWNGGGANDNFSTTLNWGGVNGNTYGIQNFAGSTRTTPFADGTGELVTHRFFFNSGAAAFTISGRAIRFYDFSGTDPLIQNNSANLQTINNSVSGDGHSDDPLRLSANSGDLRFGGTVSNMGAAIIITGGSSSRYVEFAGSVVGSGNLEIDSGQAYIAQGGSINSLGGGVFVGNGGTTTTGAKLMISDADGGTTVSKTITINPGDGTGGNREIGGLNTSGVNTFSGNISRSTGSDDRTLTISAASGGTVDIDGVISGDDGVIIRGPGIVRYGGNNSYSAYTSIESGQLHIKEGATLSAGGTVFVGNGSTPSVSAALYIADTDGGTTVARTLQVNPGSSANRTIGGLNTSGNNTFSGGVTLNDTATFYAQSGGTVIFSGALSGSGGVTVQGGGVVRYDNTGNSYSGNTTINNGTLRVGASGVIGNSSAITINSSGTLDVNGFSEAVHSISGSGNVTLGSGTLTVLNGGTTLSGVISGSGGSIIYQGSGTWTLTGVNTYSGYTYIDRGIFSIGSGGDITASSGIDLGSAVYNPGGGAGTAAATLELQSGAADLDRTVVVKGGSGSRTITNAGNNSISGTILQENNLTVNSGSGTLTLGAVTMNNSGNNDLNVNGAGNVIIGGTITASAGASEINKSNSGTLTIAGNNSGSLYMLNIAGGTVILSNANALGTAYSDKVNMTGTSTLRVSANVGPSSLGVRVGSGVTGTIQVDSGNTFTVATLSNISGSGTFNKTGAGTMVLTGNSSSFSGNVNVNGGTLQVNSSASLGGTTTVNSGGTLTGSGTVGTLTIASGGTLSPGSSPGTIYAGSTTWAGGGNYLWEINDVDAGAGTDPGWDLLSVSGTLTITATPGNEFNILVNSLTLANLSGNVHDFNGSNDYIGVWVIAHASGGISGFAANKFLIDLSNFSNPWSGSWYVSQVGTNLYLNYDWDGSELSGGGGGSAIPEPNTLIYFSIALTGLISIRRKLKNKFIDIRS